MCNIVEVNSLSKCFNNNKILDNISLNIKKNEIHSLIGPNGAGKTTLLRCMLGLIKPSSGTVKVNKMSSYAQREKIVHNVGVVLDDGGAYHELTGLSNLIFFSGIYSIKKKEVIDKIDQYDTIFDLKQHLNKKVKHYSKGMIQKLKILRELIHNPNILFLDEPFLYLDPISKTDVCNTLLHINKAGVTIFVISHDLYEVEKISDRITMIKHGKIHFSDETHRILQPNVHQKKYRLIVKDGNLVRNKVTQITEISIHKINNNEFIISKNNESISIINYLLSLGIEVEELSSIKVDLGEIFMEGVSNE